MGAEVESNATEEVEREEAKAALARVLSGSAFARSHRNRTLLSYLVDETIEGRGDTLNGTTVGQDALDKDEAFDPASDPSVRVQMGRLRRLLDNHYEGEGAGDPIRIVLRKGIYTPSFERVDPAPPRDELDDPERAAVADGVENGEPHVGPSSRRATSGLAAILRRRAPWLAGAVAAAIAVLVAAFILLPEPEPEALGAVEAYPIVVVRPFDNRTGDAENDVLAAGLQRQFAADLQRFRTARVLLAESSADGSIPRGDQRADFTVTGSLLQASETLDAITWLVDASDANIVETERLMLDVGTDDYVHALEQFSARLSANVAAPRGRLSTAARRHFEEHVLGEVPDMPAFRCWSMFNAFIVARRESTFRSIHDCLSRGLARDPTDGTMLAALGWMELLGSAEASLLDVDSLGVRTSLQRSEDLVRQAIAVAPGNDVAHVYHGLVSWFLGNEREALDSMRRAVRLNPADPQHKADYGMFLCFSGAWDVGIPLIEEAIAWDVDPPGWYRMPLFYRALVEGNPRAALGVLAEGAAAGDPFEPIYRIAAENMSGRQPAVERLHPAVMELADRHGGDVLGPVRRWIRSPEILGVLERELREIGVPVGDETPVDEATNEADRSMAVPL